MNKWEKVIMPDVKPVPEGMHSVTPHLICAGAAGAIESCKRAFATHIRDVSDEKIRQAALELCG